MSTEERIARFLEDRDALPDAEFERLLEALHADADLARDFKDLLILDDLCARELGPDRRGFRAQVAQRLRDLAGAGRIDAAKVVALDRAGARSGRRLGSALGAAALLAVALAVAWTLRPRPTEALATLRTAPGEITVLHAGSRAPARAGQRLFLGNALLHRGGEDAVLDLADGGSVLELKPGSSLKLARAGSSPAFELSSGALEARIARRAPGTALSFLTPEAEVLVVGTRLSLEVAERVTKVEVLEGRVAVTRKEDGEILDLEAGTFVTVEPGRELVALQSAEGAAPEWPAEPDAQLAFGPWEPLFDGSTLKGWTPTKGVWSVEDGALVALAPKQLDQASIGCDAEMGDFELRFSYKVEGSAYLEFKQRVTSTGGFYWGWKERNSAGWTPCVLRMVGGRASFVSDPTRGPAVLEGRAEPAGRIRFYLQNRGVDGPARLWLKDLELRKALP
ncbi:MAG: DUF1080 domain-containing protein [Planctomycetota bacterium]|nr:DUF1080 domain-containing protein [Planctomycetota bacterium]